MEKTIVDLQKYLDKMGYSVKIQQKKNGVSVTYPSKNTETKIDYDVIINNSISYYLMNYNNECHKSMEVPAYAIELLICSHIYRSCQAVGFNPNLVKFYNNKKQEISDFPVGLKLNKVNHQKREKLMNIVSRLEQEPIDNLIAEAKMNNVWDGFKLVHDLK